MQTLQIYIGTDRLDLFDDETVSVTQTIKNAKDISKVFTTFSKQFTVPASKTNNKIFKHYYNFHITNGFDARVRSSASMELNHMPFRKGKMKLDGVDLRDNKPYAYRVTFYGSVVELKDVLGEDKLPSLTSETSPYLLNIDKPYDSESVKTALTSAVGADGTLIPLITHSQRLYFDSVNSSQQSGNLFYGNTTQGLKFLQLKYAIRLDKIIEAIEDKYPEITFASDSFFKSGTTDISNLYMWCHRKKGQLEILAGDTQVVGGFNPSENISSTVLKIQSDTQGAMIYEATTQADVLTFETTVSAANSKFLYDIVIFRDSGSGYEYYQEQNGNLGSTVMTILDPLIDGYKYKAYVRTYESACTFSSMKWKCTYVGGTDEFTVSNKSFVKSFDFNIAENMPEMKIIDFLSSLFKMFNLVAYVEDNGEIQVQPLDTYYTSQERDISKYIDNKKSQVNTVLPYKEIFLKYKDTKTILAEQHYQELSTVEWGGIEYTDPNYALDGTTYKVEPDFHHAKYEKLLNVSDNNIDTGVQVGYFVTDNEESYLGKPLIMYVDRHNGNVNIAFLDRLSMSAINTTTGINMPSNTLDIDNASSNNIHFDSELSEYTNIEATASLFERFYKNYLVSIFRSSNRLTKVNSYLPAGVILQIELSDIIVINGLKYRINSMTTNLKDGKTEFELLNI